MDFFIRQGSVLPLLKMELIKDGRNDYKQFHTDIQTATVTFTMKDANNGRTILSKASCILAKKIKENTVDNEYYIVYNWSTGDTNLKGTYSGEFDVTFSGGTILKAPIKNDLFIHIN